MSKVKVIGGENVKIIFDASCYRSGLTIVLQCYNAVGWVT